MAEEIKEWKATGIVGHFLGKDWWITRIHRIQADAIAAKEAELAKMKASGSEMLLRFSEEMCVLQDENAAMKAQLAIAAQPVKADKALLDWLDNEIAFCNGPASSFPPFTKKLQTIRDALFSIPPPEPRNGWQPIESAPKDGEIIDLWEDGGRYPECWWSAQQWISYVTGTSGKKKEDHSYYVIENPTHWQPLPASPPCVGGKDG